MHLRLIAVTQELFRNISAIHLLPIYCHRLHPMQTTLNMMYLNSCMIDEENHRREMEQMKEEITQEVLSRISATVDVTEIFDAIDGLNEKIESLGK